MAKALSNRVAALEATIPPPRDDTLPESLVAALVLVYGGEAPRTWGEVEAAITEVYSCDAT